MYLVRNPTNYPVPRHHIPSLKCFVGNTCNLKSQVCDHFWTPWLKIRIRDACVRLTMANMVTRATCAIDQSAVVREIPNFLMLAGC